jgi:hypothetical protein
MSNKLPNQAKPPIFDIPTSVWKTINFADVEDTFEDMMTANLIHPPFPHFFVRAPFGSFVEATRNYVAKTGEEIPNIDDFPDWIKEFAHRSLVVEYQFRGKKTVFGRDEYDYRTRTSLGDGKDALPFNLVTQMPRDLSETMDLFVYKTLVTLLVTKNCDRKVVENTPRAKSKQAREDSKTYSTTTYISIGRITETHRSEGGSRGPTRAHLRRGHIRRQRFGEGRSEVKTIFIPPVFVNADREWIDDRKKYKLVA